MVFSLPVTLRANWVFRVTEIRSVTSYIRALRRCFLLLGVCPVWITFAILSFAAFPWKLAVPHLICLALIGIALCEFSIHNFHKLPFTCSYLPGKGNLQYGFWILVALLILSPVAGGIEWKLLQRPVSTAIFFASLCGLAVWARLRTTKSAERAGSLQFDEIDNEGILSLKLSSDRILLSTRT